ncbi:hypothetical protein BHM03_00006598 [Ensete ventricosum]|nr:hypothetical protein BHM03_00006598 [Ensete ventricosum]
MVNARNKQIIRKWRIMDTWSFLFQSPDLHISITKVTHLQSSLSDQVGMASSVSFTSSGPSSSIPLPQAEERRPCNPEEGQSKPPSSSSGIMTRTDVRAFKALEIMTLCHDFNSTVSVESLVAVQKCYSIPNEYALYDPLLRKRPYHTYPERFSIFVDALEAGLRIPLHPVIGNASAGGGSPLAKWHQTLGVIS